MDGRIAEHGGACLSRTLPEVGAVKVVDRG